MGRPLRFRYNPIFLPEYFSTVTISVPVSAFFLSTQFGGGVNGPNAPMALLLYACIAFLLILLTLFYRFRYRKLIFTREDNGDVVLTGGGQSFRMGEMDQIDERISHFFGRKARTLHLEDSQGWPLDVTEALIDYDRFREVLTHTSGAPIIERGDHLEEEAERVRRLWQERQEMFPAARNVSEAGRRLGWRCVCLLPVGVFDVVINVMTILSLNSLKLAEYMVYSAPLSLITSGLVARYVYYYMFTSTAMNRPIGQ